MEIRFAVLNPHFSPLIGYRICSVLSLGFHPTLLTFRKEFVHILFILISYFQNIYINIYIYVYVYMKQKNEHR